MFLRLHTPSGADVIVNMQHIERAEPQGGRTALVRQDRSPLHVRESLDEIEALLASARCARRASYREDSWGDVTYTAESTHDFTAG